MVRIGLFYGSTTGNALKVAELIQKAFDAGQVEIVDVGRASPDDLKKYDVLILGTSTWHWGGLQDEWAAFEDHLTREVLADKKVAFFGVRDQARYPDHFVDGMGLLYDRVKRAGVQVIGTWPKDGYNYEASAAEVDGRLIGLALDEDNEPGSTPGRVQVWVRQIKKELGL